MSEPCILRERKGPVEILTLNRPQVLNALSQEMVRELLEGVRSMEGQVDVRVLVLRGAGGSFCAGADLSLFEEESSSTEWVRGMRLFSEVIRTLRRIPQPVVVALEGAAVGGGANLALAGDFVVAAHTARIRQNFVHIGAVLDGGGTFFLPRLVGLAKARELALLGEEVDGRTAASMGLIYRSVPEGELERAVMGLANALSQKPLMALSLIKQGIDGSLNKTLEEVLEWETAHQAIMLTSPEHKEMVRWFLQMKALRAREGRKQGA